MLRIKAFSLGSYPKTDHEIIRPLGWLTFSIKKYQIFYVLKNLS